MLNQKKISLFAICFMLLCQNLYSQTILQGIVFDNGREFLGNGAEAVVNALVILTDQSDTSRSFSTYTDAQGRWSIQITSTGVDDYPPETPVDFQLMQNYPNPFNPSTVISFNLTKPSEVTLVIYNVLGQKIKTLIGGHQPAGTGHVIWDATDDLGHGVSTGVYIYSLQTDRLRISKKMLLIDGQQGNATTQQLIKTEPEIAGQSVLNKQMSAQYLLEVTGDDIVSYKKEDLDITGIRYLVVTVVRIVTDIDGNVYKTVKVGDQWWMAENLKVTHYQNGDSIPNVTSNSEWSSLSTGAYSSYDNDANNAALYGRLYNWYAVNDSRSIAPAGWHVPSDEEWKQLEMALGMSQTEANNTGRRGTNEGAKLKETGTIEAGTGLWYDPNTGATNESGFTARPGGWRYNNNGYFVYRGYAAYFWSSSTESSNSYAWNRALPYNYANVGRGSIVKQIGFSVRLVRD